MSFQSLPSHNASNIQPSQNSSVNVNPQQYFNQYVIIIKILANLCQYIYIYIYKFCLVLKWLIICLSIFLNKYIILYYII